MVASVIVKNKAMNTMKIAGPLPMPNRKIATGSHATGETGSEQSHGRKHQLPEQTAIADQNPHAEAGDRRDREAGEHPHRR